MSKQRDLSIPPPSSLIELVKDIVYFADQAGMADDCWRWRLGALRKALHAEQG